MPVPERARTRARSLARTRAHANRALPGPGPETPNGRAFLMAGTRGWPFPAEGYSKFHDQREVNGRLRSDHV